MPLVLTTPIDTGDLDTVDYGEVKIVAMHFDLQNLLIVVEYEHGNTVDGVWAKGAYKNRESFIIKDIPAIGVENEPSYVPADPAFSLMVGTCAPQQGESVYAAVKRSLYEYVVGRGMFAGTIS